VQLAVCGEALDRRDFRTVDLKRQQRAGLHRSSIHVHDAGAALARIATDVRAGEPKLAAQKLDEKGMGFDFDGLFPPVDRQGHGRHGIPPNRARGPSLFFGFDLSRRYRPKPEAAFLFLFYNYSVRPGSGAVKTTSHAGQTRSTTFSWKTCIVHAAVAQASSKSGHIFNRH
jgi:hypothetical protein